MLSLVADGQQFLGLLGQLQFSVHVLLHEVGLLVALRCRLVEDGLGAVEGVGGLLEPGVGGLKLLSRLLI